MYSAVALDLDGTLVDDQLLISAYTQTLLKGLVNQGIEIIIATGRGLSKALAMTQSLDFHYTVIANNGAIAVNEDRSLLFSAALAEEISQEIIGQGQEVGLTPFLYLNQMEPMLLVPNHYPGCYHEKSVVHAEEWSFYKDYQGSLEALSIVYCDRKQAIQALDQELAKKDHSWTIHWTNHRNQSMNLYEIQNAQATKAQALKRVLAEKKIPLAACVAMGDDLNDLSMMQEVGLGIAMKNAVDPVKAQAHRTSLFTNNEDGVAKELAQVFGLESL